jgi:hypothetical protein
MFAFYRTIFYRKITRSVLDNLLLAVSLWLPLPSLALLSLDNLFIFLSCHWLSFFSWLLAHWLFSCSLALVSLDVLTFFTSPVIVCSLFLGSHLTGCSLCSLALVSLAVLTFFSTPANVCSLFFGSQLTGYSLALSSMGTLCYHVLYHTCLCLFFASWLSAHWLFQWS